MDNESGVSAAASQSAFAIRAPIAIVGLHSRWRWIVPALVFAATGAIVHFNVPQMASEYLEARQSSVELTAGWTVKFEREFPEQVSVLFGDSEKYRIFVGTRGNANIHQFQLGVNTSSTVAAGLGEQLEFGLSEVSAIALEDIDGDGKRDLLAQTSQIHPRGRPKLYAWSMMPLPVLLGVAQPAIESSWSHGLGFVRVPGERRPSILSTHCGYGEVVEYRLEDLKTRNGHTISALSWKKVATLPCSGESLKVVDADNRGIPDVCIAMGFSEGHAELRLYNISRDSVATGAAADLAFKTQRLNWKASRIFDEGHRFGNVRFTVADVDGDGRREIIAFWCSGLSSGDCEIIRYRISPDGKLDRFVMATGKADDLWPLENQISVGDVDGDGNDEVWFGTGSGNLWRHSGRRDGKLERILHHPGGLGPVLAFGDRALYLGAGKKVLRVGRAGTVGNDPALPTVRNTPSEPATEWPVLSNPKLMTKRVPARPAP